MKNFTFLFLFLFTFLGLHAQISEGGQPYTLSHDLQNLAKGSFVLPALNHAELLAEDAANGKNGILERTAVIRPTNLNPYNAGVWTTLANGDRIWRLELTSVGAFATTLLYSDFSLPIGAKLYLYQEDLFIPRRL